MSETTNREDKGQNRAVIDWLSRTDAERPFLITSEGAYSYGLTASEVRSRLSSEPKVLRPRLDPGSVFDILAGIAGGGAIVADPHLDVADAGGVGEAALVVYTSGSSGPPKGVRLTTSNLEAAARSSVEHLGHGENDTWLLAMPLTHVGGLSILVRSAYAGGSVRMLEGFDVAEVSRSMKTDVTMVSVVPTMLSRLLEHDPGPYRGLRAVLVGGGPIPEGLLQRAADAGLPVLPTYGMTETFGQIATLRPDARLDRSAHPVPGAEVRIMADGRIAVRGAQVSPGYLGEPDRVSDWLETSDLGEIDAKGALRVLGRSDTLIVTGGENVDPGAVEAEVTAAPGVRESMVVGVPHEEWGTAVACLYVGDADTEEVASWARRRLPGHMVPKMWKRVEEIPRTPLGKPDRSAAAQLF